MDDFLTRNAADVVFAEPPHSITQADVDGDGVTDIINRKTLIFTPIHIC